MRIFLTFKTMNVHMRAEHIICALFIQFVFQKRIVCIDIIFNGYFKFYFYVGEKNIMEKNKKSETFCCSGGENTTYS
jgi:hypothetical protein